MYTSLSDCFVIIAPEMPNLYNKSEQIFIYAYDIYIVARTKQAFNDVE